VKSHVMARVRFPKGKVHYLRNFRGTLTLCGKRLKNERVYIVVVGEEISCKICGQKGVAFWGEDR
jgi:hypothetical protein